MHRPRPSPPLPSRLAVRAFSLALLLFSALVGCRCRPAPAARPEPLPALRIAVLSTAAGAVEPCGCVKDMLGGVDHAGAYLRKAGDAPLLVLGAGPMLFMDPSSKPDRVQQDRWKAEAMSSSLRELGLRAWAPGLNDFALGAAELQRITQGGPALLAANLSGANAGAERTAMFTVGGVRVGVVGISRPAHGEKKVEGVIVGDPRQELEKAALELQGQGASLRIALIALPRGEALRLVEAVPNFQLAVLGKASDQGDANDTPVPPTQVGKTLVVEGPNHLQALYVVDWFVKDKRFEFVNGDSSGEAKAELDRRISELEERIRAAEKSASVSKADLEARRKDLAAVRAERSALDQKSAPPEQSYYRAKLVEVRENLGTDPNVKLRLDEYYKRVNEHNRVAFKDKRPPPVPEGSSGFSGLKECASCHQEEHAFWSTTRHAGAYETLAKQNKQFNLDCVGCHVTGYDEPGGSTVTFVDELKDVQCETCHGPGSRHAANPSDKSLIVGTPSPTLCAPKCHHPPHVKPDWNVGEAWMKILGKGHGRGL
jgi:hypothetical protein